MFFFLKFSIMIFSILLLLISFFTTALFQIIYAQDDVEDPNTFSSDYLWSITSPIDPNCQVDIKGDSPIMYPGNFTHLYLDLNGTIPKEYSWAIEPDIVKDYDDEVVADYSNNVYSQLHDVTPLGPEDFKNSDISFYWKLEADTNRTVAVRVLTEDGICEDIESYTVAIGNTSDTQPEDFYVASKAPDHQKLGHIPRVLYEHDWWHYSFFVTNPFLRSNGDKPYSGEKFFTFHKLFLDHFDAFRTDFGYPAIEAWDPGTAFKNGSDVDFSTRSESGYILQKLPSWFEVHPSGTSRPERESNGMRCEKDYPPSASWPDKTQDSLNDFEPNQELLGCALTYPYHDHIHSIVGGNKTGSMTYADSAPLDPLFWRLHKFIDTISEANKHLTPVALIGNVPLTNATSDGMTPLEFVGNASMLSDIKSNLYGLAPLRGIDNISESIIIDRSPPQIEFTNPSDIYPNITEIPKLSEEEAQSVGLEAIAEQAAISVSFNEPITGLVANDLTVNESPATRVDGQGPGPYIFTGFKEPEMGSVNVTLSSGNIMDLSGNLFQGEFWNYALFKPTIDTDRDGIYDGVEINKFFTDPTTPDTDGDSMPDGFETNTSCLNPIQDDSQVVNISGEVINSTGRDADKDGATNIKEYEQGTSPCHP